MPLSQKGDNLRVLLQKLLVLLNHDLILRRLQHLKAQIGFGDSLGRLFGALGLIAKLIIAGKQLRDGGARQIRIGDGLSIGKQQGVGVLAALGGENLAGQTGGRSGRARRGAPRSRVLGESGAGRKRPE